MNSRRDVWYDLKSIVHVCDRSLMFNVNHRAEGKQTRWVIPWNSSGCCSKSRQKVRNFISMRFSTTVSCLLANTSAREHGTFRRGTNRTEQVKVATRVCIHASLHVQVLHMHVHILHTLHTEGGVTIVA